MNDIKTIREKVRSLHVLLVDDEDLILEGTSAFLRKFFDQVDTAKNGEIGLEKFKNDGPYDIVLSDIQMPKMSGDKLIEANKKDEYRLFLLRLCQVHRVSIKIWDSVIYISQSQLP